MKTILIPNVTSARNVGDAAMLYALLRLIKSIKMKTNVRLQSSDPIQYSLKTAKSIKPTIYYWAVFDTPIWYVRLWRVCLLFIAYVTQLFGKVLILNNQLKQLLEDYQQADLVILVGGGYLRSKKGFNQTLNLLMQLWMIMFVKAFKAPWLVAPISFGPFAYLWQGALTAWVLQESQCLSIREKISLKAFNHYYPKQAVLSADHALLTPTLRLHNQPHELIKLGFTIRNWLDPQRQARLEYCYLESLCDLGQTVDLEVVPIVQVDAPVYGDNDRQITERLALNLRHRGIRVKRIQLVDSVWQAQHIYSSLDLLLGMRMHSNILAATQGVPFVAIAYEHKTMGIARMLGLNKYCIACEAVEPDSLLILLKRAIANRNSLTTRIQRNLERIRVHERQYWEKLIESALAEK